MLIMSRDVRKGLNGVVLDETAIVMQSLHHLAYRGYAIEDLCAHCTFAEVAYLVLHGDLPDADQLQAFHDTERPRRMLSEALYAILSYLPPATSYMDMLQIAVSYLGATDPLEDDNSPSANLDKGMRLLAVIPTLIATHYRRRQGLPIIAPRVDLSFTDNFFFMCFGEIPNPTFVRCFRTALILYTEHGFNPSTFTARVSASTLSDLYSAVTAAMGCLKGPLHGGANKAVMKMLLDMAQPERVVPWLDQAFAAKKRIMGFGHRIYKEGDPRVPIMHAALVEVAQLREDGQKWLTLQATLTQAMRERRNMYPNIDYEMGLAYYLMGFEVDMFTALFVMSRVVGWTAHVIEQMAANKMIRPLSVYVGPAMRSVLKTKTQQALAKSV